MSEYAKSLAVSAPGGYEGTWSPDLTPYMIEPMDCLADRRYEAVVFVGAARSGKTQALVDSGFAYYTGVNPADTGLFFPTQANARDFSIRRVDRLIRNNAELQRGLITGHGDNVFDKHFKQGNMLTLGWPSAGQLRQREFLFVALSDYDAMDLDVDGEGSPFALARKRTQTYMSAGKTLVETSPGHVIRTDVEWMERGHEAPPTSGALELYNDGDRRWWYWHCPQCERPFPAQVRYLVWEDLGEPLKSAETVVCQCPHCQARIPHTQKQAMNSRGRWYREGELEGNPRESRVASFWMEGAAAAFQPWSQLIYRTLVAKAAYDATGSIDAWKATVNVDHGRPFAIPRQESGRDTLKLLGRAEKVEKRTVPDGVRFLTVAVDQQKTRFVVQVQGWGEGKETWLVDRFNLQLSPRLQDDGKPYQIEPFSYQEDWQVLKPLLSKTYQGNGREFAPLLMLIDSGGLGKATEHAYTFWRNMAKEGLGDRVALTKGVPKAVKRVALSDAVSNAEKARLYIVNVNALKDEVDRDLSREEPGEGYVHFPDWLGEWFYNELGAEVRTAKGWEKRMPKLNNEAFDLMVLNKAAFVILGGETIDWKNPPAWARVETQKHTVDFKALGERFKQR